MTRVSSNSHWVKSIQIRSISWSVFSCIRTEYRELRRKSSYWVRIQENTDQKKLRIWTLHAVSGKDFWTGCSNYLKEACLDTCGNNVYIKKYRNVLNINIFKYISAFPVFKIMVISNYKDYKVYDILINASYTGHIKSMSLVKYHLPAKLH